HSEQRRSAQFDEVLHAHLPFMPQARPECAGLPAYSVKRAVNSARLPGMAARSGLLQSSVPAPWLSWCQARCVFSWGMHHNAARADRPIIDCVNLAARSGPRVSRAQQGGASDPVVVACRTLGKTSEEFSCGTEDALAPASEAVELGSG